MRVLASLLVLAVVVGCAPVAPVPPLPLAEQPLPGGRLIQLSTSDIEALQPILASTVATREMVRLIYASLTSRDAVTGEVRPELGRWTTSADGRVYSWEIEPGARWSDGQPIVAEDYLTLVKAQARSKKFPGGATFHQIVGFGDYEAGRATSIAGFKTDGKRMTITLTAATCVAVGEVFARPLLPAHVFGRYLADNDPAKNLDDAPENIAPPVSSGPFLFVEWRKGDQLLLRRNQTYWKGAPLLEEFVRRVVTTTNQQVTELKSGTAQMAWDVRAPALLDLEREPQVRVLSYPQNGYTFLGWNLRTWESTGLGDRRIRQALAHGLDMNLVIRHSPLQGRATRVVAHHPPVSWAYPSGLNEYRYDPGRAEELIRSAGYTKGPDGLYQKAGRTLEFSAVTNAGNTVREAFLQLAADQYKAIGVRMTTTLQPFAILAKDLMGGTFKDGAFVIGWSDLTDDPYDIWHSSQIPDAAAKRMGSNLGAFANATLDAAIERARNGPNCSRVARKAEYDTVNRILNEEQPYNFGYAEHRYVVVPMGLQGLLVGAFGLPHHNIEKWWFKP